MLGANQFKNKVTAAHKGRDLANLRSEFGQLDVLILEDIQIRQNSSLASRFKAIE